MKTNAAALALIKEFEGFMRKWYPDPAHGWKVPTIGYGHTDSAGSPKYATSKSMVLTEAEGSAILQRDLGQYEASVAQMVKVPLNENQFGALVSFTYNLGAGNLGSSTLLRKLNTRDYTGAADEFARWNKADGKVLAGLTRRRAAERALFVRRASLIPVTNARPQPKPVRTTPTASVVAIIAAIGAAIALFFGAR